MNAADPVELDELENLVTSGAWQRFVGHVQQEWGQSGETFKAAWQRAIAGGVGTEVEAVHRLKVVAAQQEAILGVLRWPHERISQIKTSVRQQAVTGPSRRGGL